MKSIWQWYGEIVGIAVWSPPAACEADVAGLTTEAHSLEKLLTVYSDAYSPKPDEYSPKPDEYSPKPDEYSPKPDEYSPKPDEYSPKPDEYSPKPDEYSPKPDEYSPRPNGDSSRIAGLRERFIAFIKILIHAQEQTIQQPFWSLAPIAALPKPRGKGMAYALINKKLKEIDKACLSCFLGTQDKGNVAIYEEFAFQKLKARPYFIRYYPLHHDSTWKWMNARFSVIKAGHCGGGKCPQRLRPEERWHDIHKRQQRKWRG